SMGWPPCPLPPDTGSLGVGRRRFSPPLHYQAWRLCTRPWEKRNRGRRAQTGVVLDAGRTTAAVRRWPAPTSVGFRGPRCRPYYPLPLVAGSPARRRQPPRSPGLARFLRRTRDGRLRGGGTGLADQAAIARLPGALWIRRSWRPVPLSSS